MAHHVIYVPGLSDHLPQGQMPIIQWWRLLGLHPHYLALGWNKQEGFSVKLSRILQLIKKLETDGHQVSLVGVSAGASAVVSAFAAHKSLHRVVCISGKLIGPETVGQEVFDKNPDFKESVFGADKYLKSMSKADLARIMSTHPTSDQRVPIEATIIPGAIEKPLPGHGHSSGILVALTYGAPAIARFIRAKD